MPEFTYTARNKEGQTIADTVIAPTREAVGQILRNQGLLPTSIEEKRRLSLNFQNLFSNLIKSVSLLEKLTFVNNLAVTIRAGLPISRALGILEKQMPNPYFRHVIGTLAHNVETGQTLSSSMAVYPRVFSTLMISMVKVGESTGELDKTLEYLGTQISRDYNLLRRTKGALIYPAVVFFALLIIGYLMFTFVLPKLTATFKEFQTDLPFLTTLIVKVVDLVSHYSLLIAGLIVISIFSFFSWKRTPGGKIVTHRVILFLPVIGKLVKKINLARFTIVLSSLMHSGMSIVEALKTTSETVSNIYYQRAIADASEKVKVGVDLVAVLEKHPELFASMVTQMVQVGEETGTMEKVLNEVANFYEAEVDDTVKNLSSIIEPILVIVIGAVVGVLAVGLILPIYSIGQNI